MGERPASARFWAGSYAARWLGVSNLVGSNSWHVTPRRSANTAPRAEGLEPTRFRASRAPCCDTAHRCNRCSLPRIARNFEMGLVGPSSEGGEPLRHVEAGVASPRPSRGSWGGEISQIRRRRRRPGVTAAPTTAALATGAGPGVTALATTAVLATGWPMTPRRARRAGLSGISVSFFDDVYVRLDRGDDRLDWNSAVRDQLTA